MRYKVSRPFGKIDPQYAAVAAANAAVARAAAGAAWAGVTMNGLTAWIVDVDRLRCVTSTAPLADFLRVVEALAIAFGLKLKDGDRTADCDFTSCYRSCRGRLWRPYPLSCASGGRQECRLTPGL